jgi:hypothetical protein
MKIAFFIRHFGERGTEVSVYSYAHYNEVMLGNQSVIIGFKKESYQKYGLVFQDDVFQRFASRFRVILVDSFNDVNRTLIQEGVDVYYTQTHGAIERFPFGDVTACTYVVHCVFETRQPHGDIYISISQQLNERFKTSCPVVPYIVDIPQTNENLREQLGIPEDAIVFGRHGALDTFDIQIAKDSVKEVATNHPEIHFVFMNTYRFCDLPNVHYLDKTLDPLQKRKFINTCDAYLHARSDGETFGLAVAEFAVCKKPILAFEQCTDDAHFRILGDKIIKYTCQRDLVKKLVSFRKGMYDMENNGYMQFTPENVMPAFRTLVCRPKAKPLSWLNVHKNSLF